MKACNEKLKSSLMEAMKLDNARLEEEMQHCEPHIFSPEFERRMENLLVVRRSRDKVRGALRYIAAAVLVLFLTGGILLMGSEDLSASGLKINIVEWLDKFLKVENDKNNYNFSEISIMFNESMIGYLPKGFIKSEEIILYSAISYKYKDESGNTILIRVTNGLGEVNIDNEEISKEVLLNEAGYEYTRVYKGIIQKEILIWKDNNNLYYYLSGNIGSNELLKIMNGISYVE